MKTILLSIAIAIAAGTASAADKYIFRTCTLDDLRELYIYVETNRSGEMNYYLQLITEGETHNQLRPADFNLTETQIQYNNERLSVKIDKVSEEGNYPATVTVDGRVIAAICSDDEMERF